MISTILLQSLKNETINCSCKYRHHILVYGWPYDCCF